MTNSVNANGMTLAPGVVDTIISIAVSEVDGVAAVGSKSAAESIRSKLTAKPSNAGIESETDPDGKLHITLHIEAEYGNILPDLADKIRENVSNALLMQLGMQVSSIDIYVDAIRF